MYTQALSCMMQSPKSRRCRRNTRTRVTSANTNDAVRAKTYLQTSSSSSSSTTLRIDSGFIAVTMCSCATIPNRSYRRCTPPFREFAILIGTWCNRMHNSAAFKYSHPSQRNVATFYHQWWFACDASKKLHISREVRWELKYFAAI